MKRLLSILLLLVSSASMAESGAYRVEVIVFRNLLVTTEATEVADLRSFSHFPDTAEINVPATPVNEPINKTANELTEPLPEILAEWVPDDLPDDLRIIAQKSTHMDGVWRRLRSSEGYRPLVYTSWEQNRTDYYPPMRVHDTQIIDTQLRPPTHILVADLAAEDPLTAYRSTFYRIDGGAQLRRSRFLHLYLDLEFRENTLQDTQPSTFFGNTDIQPLNLDISEHPNRVYTLKQNRQIRSRQMQYFDTPYFGVLVFVSNVSAQ
jgi:hypothetical protein